MREDSSVKLDYIMFATSDIGYKTLLCCKSTEPVGTCFKVKEHVENIN